MSEAPKFLFQPQLLLCAPAGTGVRWAAAGKGLCLLIDVFSCAEGVSRLGPPNQEEDGCNFE